MATPERGFSDREALDLVLLKARATAPAIAEAMLAAINSGKETVLERSGKKKRVRRDRLTDHEALATALGVLHAYFVELPAVADSARNDMRNARVAERSRTGYARGPAIARDEPVEQITFELQAEGFFDSDVAGLMELREVTEVEIEQLRSALDNVYEIVGIERGVPWRR